jgi:hypothetical protein
MKNDYLIYVHKIGTNHKEEGFYEFIFSNNPYTVDIEEWGWDQRPASTNALPPTEEYISKVLTLKIQRFQFTVLHLQNLFTYMDGFDRVIALAWEEENQELEDSVKRLVFHYGDTLDDVQDKLYARDIILKDVFKN